MTLLLSIILTLLSPCPTEDSTNCTWYADTQGNGQGQSFTVINETILYHGDSQ